SQKLAARPFHLRSLENFVTSPSTARQRRRFFYANTVAPFASVGVQVFSGFLSVIVVQQVCRDFIVGWTYSTQNELAFLSSLCAVKRRAGICRPMQVTVRIRVSTARDEQDWQGHQR